MKRWELRNATQEVRIPPPISAGGVGQAWPVARRPHQQAPLIKSGTEKVSCTDRHQLQTQVLGQPRTSLLEPQLGGHRPGLAPEPYMALTSLSSPLRPCPLHAAASGWRLFQAVQVAAGDSGLCQGASCQGLREHPVTLDRGAADIPADGQRVNVVLGPQDLGP